MDRTRLLCLPLVFAACAATGNAGVLLYTFGGNFVDQNVTPGTPDTLNNMNPSAGPAATVLTTVGDGSTAFNGGLVGVNNLLYAIGNQSLTNVATLYSMDNTGLNVTPVSTDFNTSGDGAGVVFMNGLAAIGNTFYAIGQGATTEDLYQIGAGSATDISTPDVNHTNALNGTYAGLAWDPGLNEFYAIIANANFGDFKGDYLVKFTLGGSGSIVARLSNGANTDTHLGGLLDYGGGILYDIYTNINNGDGMLEEIDLNGTPSVTTLYDTGIPLAQNAGIAMVPEPASSFEIGAGMVLLGCLFRRRYRRPAPSSSGRAL